MESLPPKDIRPGCLPAMSEEEGSQSKKGSSPRLHNIHAGQFQSRYIKVLIVEDPRQKLVACLSVGNVE